MKELRFAMLGYGGIARSHHAGYRRLAEENFPVKLVALCDINPAQFESAVDINNASDENKSTADLHLYTSFEELMEKEEFDVLDICLPTYLHATYAVRALRAGKNVLCEKPMALTVAEADEMLAAAEESGKQLMIGQCLRFSADYLALKNLLDSGEIGHARHMYMERLSALPVWGFEGWYRDCRRSGGSMQDLSIHDYDMARFLFGDPDKVFSVASNAVVERGASSSCLIYNNGLTVSVNGSWNEANSFPFSCGFRLTAEKATVTWDGRSPVKVYPFGATPYTLGYDGVDYMAEEIRHFALTVAGEIANEKNPPASAKRSLELVYRLVDSVELGGVTVDF